MALVKTNTAITGDECFNDFLHCSSNSGVPVICKSPAKLKMLIEAIKLNNCVQYVSDGDWSTNDLVMAIVNSYHPADLYLTTYAIRETPVRQLVTAKTDGLINKLIMLLDYRAKARTPEVYQLAEANATILLTNIHAKVTVIVAGAEAFTIVGSSNWTCNPRIEAGVILRGLEIADFNINWINKILDGAELFN